MKLGQVKWNHEVTAAVFDGETARPIPGHTPYDLIRRSEVEKTPLTELASTMAATPKEVWACGCTYEMSASFRDAEHNTREGFYRYVFDPANRPEVFFNGTSRVCVGPNAGIGLRADSKFTAPEPELAVVLGSNVRIVGYTISNDV